MEKTDTLKYIEHIDWVRYLEICKDEISKDFEEQVTMLPQGDNLLVYFHWSCCTVGIACGKRQPGEIMITDFNLGANMMFPSDLQLLLDLLTHISKTMGVKLDLGEKTNG